MPENVLTLEAWAEERITQRFDPYPRLFFADGVVSLCQSFGLRRVLEIGAGRTPLFDPDVLEAEGIEYNINDISREELDAADTRIPESRKACFNIAANSLPRTERYDLVFSKSVFEHVEDGLQAWSNSYELLEPGGVAFHYFPTLYCAPFVANKLLPERTSAMILKKVTGWDYKKFPAKYDHCRSTHKVEREIAQLGFSSVMFVPFWGHDYFERLPGLRGIDASLHRFAASRDWRFYSSYCYGIARR